jgi:hypothetical protein
MKSTGNARKNRARKSHGKKIGRLIGRYGAVALAGARLPRLHRWRPERDSNARPTA